MDKNKVKEALKQKLKQEMSMTGTGASVAPGVGAGVATKYAFGKSNNKGTPSDWKPAPSIPNRKSKAMDYKELWEGENEEFLSKLKNLDKLDQKEKTLVLSRVHNLPKGALKPSFKKERHGYSVKYTHPKTGSLTTGFLSQSRIDNFLNGTVKLKEENELQEMAVNLKKSKLSPKEYQEAKKLKDFKSEDWKWDAKQDLYVKSIKEIAMEVTDDLDAIKQKVISWSKSRRNAKQDSLEINWWKHFDDTIMNATTKDEIKKAILDMYYMGDFDWSKLDLDEAYDKSKIKTNADELARVEDMLKTASTSQMSAQESRIKKLKLLVGLEKKYNTELPVLHYGTDWSDYLKKQDVKTSRELEDKLSSKKENMNEMDINDRVLMAARARRDRESKPQLEPSKISNNTSKIKALQMKRAQLMRDMEQEAEPEGGPIADKYGTELDKIDKALAMLNNTKSLSEENLEEAYIPDNIKKFAQRKGVTSIVNKVARWAEKVGMGIKGGTAIGKNYDTLVLDLTYQGGEIRINCENESIEVNGEEVDDYTSFMNAAKENESLNENYARFRNETKTRTKPEQFHNAVKSVKQKVNEINRLFEYMNRLQSELSESEGGLQHKKYTDKAIQSIKESTKQLFFKSTKLK
jgi:hypothetical protein